MPITPERELFHELLNQFVRYYLPDSSFVYDIGKSLKHDYSEQFAEHNYMTIDRDPDTHPSLIWDVEQQSSGRRLQPADGILCMGVTEQCTNPFVVRDFILQTLNDNGNVLFGIALTGYPLYDKDYLRFTRKGAERFLEPFTVLDERGVCREQVPSYYFAIARKKEKK